MIKFYGYIWDGEQLVDPSEANGMITVEGDFAPLTSPSSVQLIGQGIATVGIEDRELADLDTACSEAAPGELGDTTREDGEGPETPANGGELATNSDTSFAELGDGLWLDDELSNAFLDSLA